MENYRNPPITEALFDIQVEPSSDLSIGSLEKLANSVGTLFPDKKPRRRFESRFEFQEGSPSQTQTVGLGIDGYLCWTQAKTEVVQFRLDGFGYSGLKPYQGWDETFSKTIHYWKAYQPVAKPVLIRRLVVRYINAINVPHRKFELNKYLALAPQIPSQSGELQRFLSQVSFTLPEDGVTANLIQTIGQTADPVNTPLILDLEVIKEIGTDFDLSSIEKVFNGLRSIKNELFEKCITDEARGLFR